MMTYRNIRVVTSVTVETLRNPVNNNDLKTNPHYYHNRCNVENLICFSDHGTSVERFLLWLFTENWLHYYWSIGDRKSIY